MVSPTGRHRATLLLLCAAALLNVALDRRRLAGVVVVDVGPDPAIPDDAARDDRGAEEAVGGDDFSLGPADVFGDDRAAAGGAGDDGAPPPEASWLLVPPTIAAAGSSGRRRIPRLINKIYFQKDGRFRAKPPVNANTAPQRFAEIKLQEAHESWTTLNPGYRMRYYNLLAAREYLRGHFHAAFLRTFDCVEAFAGKADFFRMALLVRPPA